MQEILTTKQRILDYLVIKGVTPYKFYKDSGVTRGVLTQESGLSEENTTRFLAYFPEVDANWLLTGDGPMLKKDTSVQKIETPVLNKGIPLIPLEAMAGFGTGEMQVMNFEAGDYVIPEFESVKADYLIRVKGSSMYPKYNSGDLIACKKLPLDTFFQWNKVYVLDTIQGPLVKRITKSKQESHIHLVSDNKTYDSFDLHLNEVYALAIVVGVIRLE